MNRRESLKTLVIGSLASSLVLEGCLSKEKKIIYENVWKYKYGRTPEELERLIKLKYQNSLNSLLKTHHLFKEF